MQLGDLFDDASLDVAAASVEIDRVEIDSRACGPGALFLAIPGSHTDGSRFATDAVARGATAVMASSPLALGVPVVVVPPSQVRATVAHVSSAIVGHPERRLELVGVTGTNGKTTVATLVGDLAIKLGWNGASMGTLTHERTTPAPPELFRSLARIADGFDVTARSVVGLEVSSHALDQGRVDGLVFAVAVFTNLSHDHLDYHGSMEAYFRAKATLFSPERAKRAVIWGDDPYGARLADESTIATTVVSASDASSVTLSLIGSTFFWRGQLVRSPLVGAYNVDNAVVAMTALSSLGASDEAIIDALADVRPVPGRFEVVSDHEIVVVVDYAHTPAGLSTLLDNVRALSPGSRVILVFGCGGDRDHEKRAPMGAVAAAKADVVFVTSDNPRSESPDAIIDAIVSGVPADVVVQREVDRQRAIERALGEARRGDVVVVAGKGHETTQTIGDAVVDFDDRAVIREILR